MTTVKEAEQLLDIIAKDPLNPKASAAQQKLGLNDKHIQAWKKTRSEPDNPMTVQVKNTIFDTISDSLPVSQKGGGVLNLGDRIKIKNLINERPDLQEKYLQKLGYDTKRDPSNPNKVVAKKKGDLRYGAIDPEGFDRFDLFDIFEEVAGGVVGAVTTGAKALGFFSAPATGGFSLAASSALGAASEAGLETGRQGLGMALGLREELDPSLITQRGLIGATLPGIGKLAEKGLKAASKQIAKRVPKFKLNANEIKEAAKELKVKTTPGMVMDSQFVQNLESQLSKESGMIGGFGLRSTIKKNIQASKEAAEEIVGSASGRTAFESGQLGKKQIIDAIEEKLRPAEIIYDNAEKIFSKKKFKPDFTDFKAGLEDLAEPFKFNDNAMSEIVNFADKIDAVKNLTELKSLRTQVRNAANVASRSGDSETAKLLNDFALGLTNVRSQTLKNLITDNPKLSEQAGMGLEAITRADKIYRETAGIVQDTLLDRGQAIKGGVKSTAKRSIEKIKETQAINKILDSSDPIKIDNVRKSFPKAFETLRTGKIEEIVNRSMLKGEINPRKLVKSIRNMPPETAALLLGKDALNKSKSLEVVVNSIPENINPSGTSFSLILDNLFSVLQQAKSVGKSGLLKGAEYSAIASKSLENILSKELTPAALRATTQVGLQSAMPKPESTQSAGRPPVFPSLGGR